MFKKIFLIIGVFALLIVPASYLMAEESFYLAPDEEYNANIYQANNLVDIRGTVNGDIFVVANKLDVSGHIKGDVIALAEDISITGQIDGNVRIAGSMITIDADIKRALSVAGQNIYINDQTQVGATLIALASNMEMRGMVAGNIDGMVEHAFISGELTHTNLRVSDMELSETAVVRGNLNYKAPIEAQIAQGATIGGDVKFSQAKASSVGLKYDSDYFIKRGMMFLSMFLIGLILVLLLQNKLSQVTTYMREDLVKTVIWGLLFMFVLPFVVVLLLATIIGIPLGIMTGIIYLIYIYLARIFAAYFVGEWLDDKYNWKLHPAWKMAIGLLIYIVVASLPYIGGAVAMVAVWMGIGALLQFKLKMFKQ